MEREHARTCRKVCDIDADQRRLLEQLLGRPLSDDEQVSILVSRDRAFPDDDGTRQAAFDRIEALLERGHRHAEEQGITAQEADAAVEEAIEHVRRHRS